VVGRRCTYINLLYTVNQMGPILALPQSAVRYTVNQMVPVLALSQSAVHCKPDGLYILALSQYGVRYTANQMVPVLGLSQSAVHCKPDGLYLGTISIWSTVHCKPDGSYLGTKSYITQCVLSRLKCVYNIVLHALHNITQGLQCKQTCAGVQTSDIRLHT
jgi:hypothetical protein